MHNLDKVFCVAAALGLWAGTAGAGPFPGAPPTPASIGAIGPVINITSSAYGVSASASNNATGLQAAINAAQTAGIPLYIPAAPGNGCYKYTAPLTITANLSIVGDFAQENWAGGINVPLGTPPVVGSVLCPSSNGSDAIDIMGTSLKVDLNNIGLRFQTPFSGTGDGIHYVPAVNVQGLSGEKWSNVVIYGHDGNHYAINLTNPIIGQMNSIHSYGGGFINLYGNSTSGNYGNTTFTEMYAQLVTGGTANCYNFDASSVQRLNLMLFERPQCIVNNVAGVTPGGSVPTNQAMWNQTANATNVVAIAPDMETNVSGVIVLGASASGNDFDWNSLFTDAASISAPAWTTNGIMWGPQTRTFNDSTSSGAVSIEAVSAFPSVHLTATNTMSLTHAPTLFLGAPIQGANVTISRPESLYTSGVIWANANVDALGMYDTGSSQFNTNAGAATTEIGDGSTTGTVTIGGASNKVQIGAGTTLTQTTVSALPTCNTAAKGYMELVTDASSPAYNAALTGGGTSVAIALCNGSAWAAH